MRLDQLLPPEMVLPATAEALERGNAALAVAIIAHELDTATSLEPEASVRLLAQGAIAARMAGDDQSALRWSADAVGHAADAGPIEQVLAASVFAFAQPRATSGDAAAATASRLDHLLESVPGEPIEAFGWYASLFAWIVAGDTVRARHALGRLRALPAGRTLWVSARAQVCEAVIDYLECNPAGVSSVLDLLQPLTVAAGSTLPLASMWWEIAELRYRLGHEEQAWAAAARAADASGVRAADGRSSFAPGVLTWDLSI